MTRKEAINIINSLKDYYNDKSEYCEDGYVGFDSEDNEALDLAIKALEQQPKKGHWEYVQYDSNPNIGNWHCSECRGICTEMHSIEDGYNYCPNCGAKMEVEE